MDKVRNGELQHLEILFDRYQKKLYNYFVKCTTDWDESKDLVQQTFMRVMKYRHSYQSGRGFEVWLFQIARNMVRDHFKKMKVYRDQFDFAERLPDQMDQEQNAETIEQERRLYQALSLMEPDKKELLVMAKLQGMKYETIAEIRESSVGAIKVQVHRAVAKLRTLYLEVEKAEE